MVILEVEIEESPMLVGQPTQATQQLPSFKGSGWQELVPDVDF